MLSMPFSVNGDFKFKLEQLKSNLKQMKCVAIAFSGGVDSTFLTKVAYDVLGENVVAVTASSSIFPKRELEEAKQFAKQIGMSHIITTSEETDIKNFSDNSLNRCYYCKKDLFSKMKKIAIENQIHYMLDGSNADDSLDYRPGMKALKELKIISPLIDVGLTKKEIRELSKNIGLETWDKPAFACLASRIPYGEKITKSKLKHVEKAEDFLSSLQCTQYRVRHHGDTARIEVLPDDFQKIFNHSSKIVDYFKKLGFSYVTLDLQGYKMGSLNEDLHHGKHS